MEEDKVKAQARRIGKELAKPSPVRKNSTVTTELPVQAKQI